jgi:small subunit ribosomal protein S4e
MARGPKKHQKRIATPKAWMLGKLQGIYSVRPSQGPHKRRESIPISIALQQKLKYALGFREVKTILNDKESSVKVDGKLRRDRGFPLGIMDVLSLEKTNERFRVLYDHKGRFYLKELNETEGRFKLLKVTKKILGPNKVPYIVTHDARTIRFPNPNIEIGDTLKYDLIDRKIVDIAKLEIGNTSYAIGGNNIGRVGIITNIEKHPGSFDIVHVKDSHQKNFATRTTNIFVLGKGKQPWISLPPANGLWLNALEEKKDKEQKGSK